MMELLLRIPFFERLEVWYVCGYLQSMGKVDLVFDKDQVRKMQEISSVIREKEIRIELNSKKNQILLLYHTFLITKNRKSKQKKPTSYDTT